MSTRDGQPLRIGLDVGSVAAKLVVGDRAGNLLYRCYRRTVGRPIPVVTGMFEEVLSRWPVEAFELIAGTGSAARPICELLGAVFVNELVGQTAAIRQLHPEARTLVEMGGQDSKLILLSAERPGSPMADFATNTNCAAGTGSFLDQQASRLGIRIEDEFGRLALLSRSRPRVAGRCSVFAKSDMIHLQQQATSLEDIVAGLCLGLARSLRGNLARGMEWRPPIAFCGGVAGNVGVVQAIEEVFELPPGALIVPECHAYTGAIGAILVALQDRGRRGADYGRPRAGQFDLASLGQCCDRSSGDGVHLAPLAHPSNGKPKAALPSRERLKLQARGTPVDVYLGLDVGSISTKVAVLDQQNRLLAKVYLMTAGRPLDAVRRALTAIRDQVGGLFAIRGAATTGSGRYLTGDFIGADVVVNEITAQATAAVMIDPDVDTIFEIGGQDSKYICLDRGVVVDFEMNHACAAGTGSFLEEQAERLGVAIDHHFGKMALESRCPIRLAERCTVFMESELLCHQQRHASTEDLIAGLCYSIVNNYLNRVVGQRRVGKKIFFQGGTAFNQGVVAAFEKVTGRSVVVPPHHEVTGAIGAALLAHRHHQQSGSPSAFRGFALADVSYQTRSFTCQSCSNACEINEVSVSGRESAYYGSRCDRFNTRKGPSPDEPLADLFRQRHELLLRYAHLDERGETGRPVMGIPLALSNYQLLPFWGTLLGQLGWRVVVSPVSTPQIIRQGTDTVLSTPCFPVKVAHGHAMWLIGQGLDRLWIPSVLNMPRQHADNPHSELCPYVTAFPYEVRAAIEQHAPQVRILSPPVRFREGPRDVLKCLRPLCKDLGVRPGQLGRAVQRAWQAQIEFEQACRARGRQVLDHLRPEQRAVILISRPYNGCDSGAYLNLPAKLRKLGVLAIPMDFLDLRRPAGLHDPLFKAMYWRYGQNILRAAAVIRRDPRLHAVYLSNFGCGPDSFLIGYFRRLMGAKPALVLEIDEHSADAGVLTRLEAFLDTLDRAPADASPPPPPVSAPPRVSHGLRTLYIPWMGDQAYGLAAAFRAFGQPAEVIPPADHESLQLGRRYCSGKECLPCIVTAGDMVRVTQRADFAPARSAFFMPSASGPCRFGQYHCTHQLILNELGLHEVPVVAPSQDPRFYEHWGRFPRGTVALGWTGICAFDVLHEALLAVRPYETRAGSTDAVYGRWCQRMCEVIQSRPGRRQLRETLRQAAADFAAVPTDRGQPRPRIGVVGEIYIRHHHFVNNDLIRQLEALGAEAMLAGLPEWHYYTNSLRRIDAWLARDLRCLLTNLAKDLFQHWRERQINKPFRPLLGRCNEPLTRRLLCLAESFLHPSLRGGEAVLSVGKMIELARHGASGAINVMPFSCMPSTIADGVMRKLRCAVGGMPLCTVTYDGQEDSTLQTRLEAFLHQARAYQATRPPTPAANL